MTLIELLKSKSSVKYGTIIDIIKGIENDVGGTIHVCFNEVPTTNQISANIETFDISSEIETLSPNANIDNYDIYANANIDDYDFLANGDISYVNRTVFDIE